MTLPTWTNNCIGSMEGLLFESSATTPYHFLDQAELSVSPSNPQVGLPYGGLDVALGVKHLQMLGVKYFLGYSPTVISQANADPSLQFIGQTKAWPAPGATWRLYRIKDASLVQPLVNLPNVIPDISSRGTWLSTNTTWWLNPSLWSTPVAQSGPANWPRATSTSDLRTVPVTSKNAASKSAISSAFSNLPFVPTLSATATSNATDVVTSVTMGLQSVSFHVSKIGVPVLVKISYYPRWQASGATGPYRVSPNLMVVVPTNHEVSLVYGTSPAVTVGDTLSFFTSIAGLAVLFLFWRRRRSGASSDQDVASS
jgi:hypothetical protein